ncbi:MAG: hypothetical protein HDQ95_10405 [Roseburia sp.]|nr:hypothetical protein [Roseburia sp.]
MIKQIKMSIKMMRYGYGLKTSIGFVAFFVLAGVLLSFVSETAPGGAYMIMVAGMWPVQMICSLGTANFVRSSPWKRPAETAAPTLLSFLNFLACYLIVFLTYLPRFAAGAQSADIAGDMIIIGALTALMMVFCGMAYKYMVAGTIIFFAAYLTIMTFSNVFKPWLIEHSSMHFFTGALIGLAEIIAGAAAEYAITCVLYKRPMSKSAQFAGLRKYL